VRRLGGGGGAAGRRIRPWIGPARAARAEGERGVPGVREGVRVGVGLYTEGGAAERILVVGSHPTTGR
jgi:hypothetical protein